MKILKFRMNVLLASFACFSIMLLSSNNYLQAQIIHYVDLDPDAVIVTNPLTQTSASIEFDIDGDEINDIRFQAGHSTVQFEGDTYYEYDCQLNSINGASIEFCNGTAYPFAAHYDIDDEIEYYSNFYPNSLPLYACVFEEYVYPNFGNGYFGFRKILSEDACCYGWFHVSQVGSESTSWTITTYEFAYCTIQNQPILAGQTEILVPASPASLVTGEDVTDYNDGRDLQVAFNKADELTVDEYKVIVVKQEDANTFTVDNANSCPNYYSVTPNGANILTILDENTRDFDGDLIQNNVDYKIFILSIANGIIANENVLSTPSESIAIGATQTQSVNSVSILDVADNGDGRDLEVTFAKIDDETQITEYRLLAVKSANAYAFDMAVANNSSYYKSLMPNGNNRVTIFANDSRDVDGDLITNNIGYKVFVLTIADGVQTSINSLSPPSNMETLTNSNQAVGQSFMSKLKIFPNPSNELIQIEISDVDFEVEIYNNSGQLILNLKNEKAVDISALPAGTYTVVVRVGDDLLHNKIVIY